MTDRYAVIGHPVEHSKSPQIHAAFARQTAQDIRYEKILAPLDGFEQTVAAMRAAGFKGANVTVPFKLEAFHLADRLTERASDAGAVNTLLFTDDGVVGDNTDGVGLVRDIQHNLAVAIQGKRVLLIGAGGAAEGVLHPVLEQQPGLLVISNRTLDKALIMVKKIEERGDFRFVSVQAPFMKFARLQQARVADGLGMLVEQAAESFYLWRGVRPLTAPVIAAFRT